MAELTREQLRRQDEVDGAIHGLFQELFGFGVAWDIEKISLVRDAVQDAFKMTDDQCFEFYPWILIKPAFQGQRGTHR